MDADYNLLYVLTAIRHGCADAATLIATYAESRSDRQTQLQELLIERGCLSLPEARKVAEHVKSLMQQHGGDARAALQASLRPPNDAEDVTLAGHHTKVEGSEAGPAQTLDYSDGRTRNHQGEKTLVELGDQTLIAEPSGQGSGADLKPGSVVDDTLDATALMRRIGDTGGADMTRTRYSLTRVHGQGGLGQVWLAVDRQLNRQVALKQIRPERDTDPQSLRRLIKEAQITGQLEHPNIVPVYELSESEDELFYTMRFLRGQTLEQEIASYHRRRADGQADPMDLRHLLQSFVGICNAMAFAASKGIVHRDLKPANVMLGSFGEVIVLDWGLAKVIGEPDEAGTSPAVAVTGDAASSKTMDGQILGTLGYLSPEQARGELKSIDARTDVYGLGAILFAILTGRAPHRRAGVASSQGTRELLRLITQGDIPEPKSAEPSTPAALNAVCVKAMARSPDDRYQSAADLAEDVSRWIADEPVSAYVEPLGVRIARFARRHRTWTQALAFSLLAIAGIATAAAFIVNGARQNTKRAWQDEQLARASAQAARETAERAWQDEQLARAREQDAREAEEAAKEVATRLFHDSQETVHRSLTGVSQALLYFPGTQRLRSALLEEAAKDLDQFAEEDSEDLQLQMEAGKAIVRLGDVRGLLSQWDQAREQYLRAIAHFTTLQESSPRDPAIQLELANCRKQLAFSLATLGRGEEASQVYDEVVSAFADLVNQAPESVEYRTAQAAALVDVAQYQDSEGDTLDAISTLEQAEAAFQQLVDHENNQPQQQGLAAAQRLQGQILGRINRAPEAIEKLKQAIAGFQALQILDPSQPDYLEELADCHINLANTLLTTGREHESLTLYRAAISDYKLLLKARPDVPQYRESMALLRRNVAQQLQREGRNREGYNDALEALREFTELVADDPMILRYHAGEAASSLTFGRLLRDVNDPLAQDAFDKAIKIYGELSATYPEYKTNLAISTTDLGRLLQKLGQPEPAREAFKRSVEILEASEAESDTYSQDALAWSYARLADVLFELGDATGAALYHEKCLTIRSGLTRQPAHLYNLGWFLTHCQDVSRRDPKRAATIAGQLIALVPENADYHNLLGVAHLRVEEWDEAVKSLEEASQIRDRYSVSDGFYLAMAYWGQGNKEEAKTAFQAAAQVMDREQPGNIDLLNLRREATALIDQPQPMESPRSE